MVNCIGKGPTRKELKFIHENKENVDLQDEMGNFVLDICKTVPYGCLY